MHFSAAAGQQVDGARVGTAVSAGAALSMPLGELSVADAATARGRPPAAEIGALKPLGHT